MLLLCGWGGLLLCAAGCTTSTGGSEAGTQSIPKAVAVPGNYRQLVARYFATNLTEFKILKAEIARPGVWESPLGMTNARPIVCAKWVSQGPILQQSHSMAFTFENGKIAEAFDPGYINPAAGGAFAAALKDAATCGKLTYVSFPEIVKSK